MVFLGGSDGKESACQAGDSSSIPGLGRSPGEGKWQLTLVFLPGESHGQRSLVECGPWGHKESDMTEGLHNNMNIIIVMILLYYYSKVILPIYTSYNCQLLSYCKSDGHFFTSSLTSI